MKALVANYEQCAYKMTEKLQSEDRNKVLYIYDEETSAFSLNAFNTSSNPVSDVS